MCIRDRAVRDDGEPFFTGSQVIHTIEKNGFKEQNPEEWYSAFCALSHALTDKISAKDISALIFSGQMQDVIPVGSDLRSLGNAILYSDGRAGAQAEAIENAVGSDTITAITGNHFAVSEILRAEFPGHSIAFTTPKTSIIT